LFWGFGRENQDLHGAVFAGGDEEIAGLWVETHGFRAGFGGYFLSHGIFVEKA
jgi:hypothetical protein